MKVEAYCLISADFRMILNVTLDILPPDDRMVGVGFEELRDVFRPCFDGIEPFLAEKISQVSLDSGDGGRSETVPEDPE